MHAAPSHLEALGSLDWSFIDPAVTREIDRTLAEDKRVRWVAAYNITTLAIEHLVRLQAVPEKRLRALENYERLFERLKPETDEGSWQILEDFARLTIP